MKTSPTCKPCFQTLFLIAVLIAVVGFNQFSLGQTVIYSQNFDGTHNWTLDETSHFSVGPPANGNVCTSPKSPANVLGTVLNGNYGDNWTEDNSYAISPAFNCSDEESLIFTYYSFSVFETSYDYGYVYISGDNGITWTKVETVNGTETGWVFHVIDISSIAGLKSQVRIKFTMASDYNNTYTGWNIDDIEVWGGKVYSSSGTFTAPAYVNNVTVQCWGGGGGGSSIKANGARGGGGGGGAYASSSVSVTPGTSYNVVVGSGGSASNKGGNSSFNSTSVVAAGGNGGTYNSSTAGSGGSTANSTGDIKYAGGNGANGGGTYSGGGGGGAGTSGAGGDASGASGGNGIPPYGGNGGNGVSGSSNGNSGFIIGGGGSGAVTNTGVDRTGGPGANGLVILSWPNRAKINVSPASLDFGFTNNGSTSAEQTYTLSGTNLQGAPGNITINAPANFEVSLTSGTGFGSGLQVPFTGPTLAERTIYVRFKPTSANTNYTGVITHSGGGTFKPVAVSGTSAYCIPLYSTGTSDGDFISLVQLGSINNSTEALSSPYYYYYSNLSTDLNRNNSYTITLTAGTYPSGNNISVWIDYNQNGTFESSEKLGNVTLAASPASGTINFTVPADAITGTTRMRVREVWNNADFDPCATYQYGETEDYNINIINPCNVVLSLMSTETCVGATSGTGTITATGSGGTAPYVYSLNGGAFQSSGIFTGLNSGTYSVTVRDNYLCTATSSVSISEPAISPDDQTIAGTNTWTGHLYDGTNFNNYYGTFSESETFDQGFGGNTNCFTVNSSLGSRSVYTETFSVRYRMNSTRRGLYTVDLGSDDGSRLTIDGTLVYDNWRLQSFSTRSRVLMSLTGTSPLVYDFYENGGANRVIFQNLTLLLQNNLSTNTTQNICLGSSGAAIGGDVFGTLPSGISLAGTGYQWTYSITPTGPRIPISGATGATFTPNSATSPFNAEGTYYIYRNTSLSSTNNVSPIPYVATLESNAATIYVTALPAATFSYTGSPYCSNEANPFPTFTGGGIAGTFSSTSGLVFVNTATGQVNLSSSTPGTYTVTNTIAPSGGCNEVSATTTIEIKSDGIWTGAINIDWNNTGNWECNNLPTVSTNVIIPASLVNYPTLSTGLSGKAKNITIQNGASLTVTGNTLQIAGDVSNSGIFTAGNGTIEMAGNSLQNITANLFADNTILNLTINNPSGVNLLGTLNISGVLKVQTGNLNTGGFLTLLSSSTQTALIDGSGNGEVTGNVTMQRYLPSGFGYKYFSSPFQSATVAGFGDDMNLNASFPSFYNYIENKESTGWSVYTDPSGLLNPLNGYCLNFGTDMAFVTADLTGIVNNHLIGPIALSNNNKTYTLGFNLIGNPYPSPIDWNAASGWTRNNIDDAIYFFDAGTTDQYTGTYSSYINGISSNGIASNIIPSMQGFFVHVSDGSYPVNGSLSINNPARINMLSPVFHKNLLDETRPIIKLQAAFNHENAQADPLVIYWDYAATATFDKKMDALKIYNTDINVPNLYALSDDRRRLSIGSFPFPEAKNEIPLGIKTEKGGSILLRLISENNLPAEYGIYLKDKASGKIQNLKLNPEYLLSVGTGLLEERLSIVFSNTDISQEAFGSDSFSAYVKDNTLFVSVLLKDEQVNVQLTNMAGQILLQKRLNGEGQHQLCPAPVTGIYLITFFTDMGTISKKIYIQ